MYLVSCLNIYIMFKYNGSVWVDILLSDRQRGLGIDTVVKITHDWTKSLANSRTGHIHFVYFMYSYLILKVNCSVMVSILQNVDR